MLTRRAHARERPSSHLDRIVQHAHSIFVLVAAPFILQMVLKVDSVQGEVAAEVVVANRRDTTTSWRDIIRHHGFGATLPQNVQIYASWRYDDITPQHLAI